MSASADPADARAVEAMSLFERWLDADEARRRELLAEIADRDLHAAVLALIEADSAAERERFLDGGALAQIASTNAEPALRDLVGARIGAWRLDRHVGVGGAGQVWLATRSDGLHRGKAAMKLLRAALTDNSARKRFAREGRVLARLTHPNIAHLLDVGEWTNGERYLVLEYVDGTRIDDYCDRASLDVEARIRLFLQVCDAVSYAHGHLVVHRDLKPSNILVQADATAKLLDFGVAKLLESDDEQTEVTRAGVAPFTPEYAAPEQFEAAPITIATDVYALGAVLYLLLAGRRPYGNETSTPAQIARALRESEPRRLSSVDDTEDTERIAARRATSPKQLRRTLSGDLDTIVAKALRKRPSDRYESVQALASDLRRYLDHFPIVARPESRVYVARKFVARHRVVVALTSALVCVLVFASITLFLQARRLEVEVTRARRIRTFVLDAFRTADAYVQQGAPANDAASMMKRAADKIDAKLGDDVETCAETHATFAGIFFRLGIYEGTRDHYARAIALYSGLLGADAPRVQALESAQIANEWMHGDVDGLMPRIDKLLARIGPDPRTLDAKNARLGQLNARVVTATNLGDLRLADATARLYATEARRFLGPEYEYAYAQWRLAIVATDKGAPRDADLLMREVTTIDRTLVAPTYPGLLTDVLAIVDVLIDYGEYEAAYRIADSLLDSRRRIFGTAHWSVADVYDRTGLLAGERGDDARAEADLASSLSIASEAYSPHARWIAAIRYHRAVHRLRRSGCAEASTDLVACGKVFERSAGAFHWLRSACDAVAAHCNAAPSDLDALIGKQRAHGARELPMALWLRARMGGTDAQKLAWLDEGLAVLRDGSRDGTRVARDIESARRALGAPASSPPPRRGEELIRIADAILAGARGD